MNGQNRRAFPRFRTKGSTYASYPGGLASISDLSLGGALLRDPEPVDVGSPIRLSLHLGEGVAFCEGVVRRVDPRGTGLEFTEIAKEDRRVLSAFLMTVAMVESRERLQSGLVNARGTVAARPSDGTGLPALLGQRGVISEDQAEAAIAYQRANPGQPARMLVRSGVISEDELVAQLQKAYSLPALDLSSIEPTEEALAIIPIELARRHEVLPIGLGSTQMTVAIADPSNVVALRAIKLRAGCDLRLMLAPALSLQRAIDHYYNDRARKVG